MNENQSAGTGKNAYEKALGQISKYLDVKKDFMDHELIQLAGDTSKIIGFVQNTTQYVSNKKFEKFLEGFSKGEPTEKQIEKLADYVDSETKAEYISDAFSKVLLSNSSKACLVMGSILNDVIESKDELDYQELTCINALVSFFDYDISNFKVIHEYSNEKSKIFHGRLAKFCRDSGLDSKSILLTLEKATTYQLLTRDIDTDITGDYNKEVETMDIDSDIEEYLKFNENGNKLISYINRVL